MRVVTLAVLALCATTLGSVYGARLVPGDGDLGRYLLATSPAPAIDSCGGHSYALDAAVCITAGGSEWLCPKSAPCACPTDRYGLKPFDCYDPAQYYCSSSSKNWPKSGLLPGAGFSNAGTCSLQAPAPAPASAPA